LCRDTELYWQLVQPRCDLKYVECIIMHLSVWSVDMQALCFTAGDRSMRDILWPRHVATPCGQTKAAQTGSTGAAAPSHNLPHEPREQTKSITGVALSCILTPRIN
jgi:hypothetical protein